MIEAIYHNQSDAYNKTEPAQSAFFVYFSVFTSVVDTHYAFGDDPGAIAAAIRVMSVAMSKYSWSGNVIYLKVTLSSLRAALPTALAISPVVQVAVRWNRAHFHLPWRWQAVMIGIVHGERLPWRSI